MSTSIQNPSTVATGLIQFMPSTARSLGTNVHALKKMSTENQLTFVHKYFKKWGLFNKRKITAEDLYCTVTAPAKVNAGSNTVVYRRGQLAYSMNKGRDTDKDGVIRKKEFGFIVKSRRKISINMLRYVFDDTTVNNWKAHLS